MSAKDRSFRISYWLSTEHDERIRQIAAALEKNPGHMFHKGATPRSAMLTMLIARGLAEVEKELGLD